MTVKMRDYVIKGMSPIRNRVFRSHAWNCLHKRVQLAQNSTAPVVEYSQCLCSSSRLLESFKNS